MATFLLELVTPERVLFSDQVRAVRVPGIEGSLGVLAGHAPLMTALDVGLLKIDHVNGDVEYVATSGGFVEVNRDKVVVLADTAERASDIDLARAEAAIAVARENLRGGEVDYGDASATLARATNRLKIAQMQQQDRQ